MKVAQFFTYLDSIIKPEKGARIQFGKKDNVETIKLFVFDKNIMSYSYIITLSLDKEEVTSKITSGFSGLDYQIKLGLNKDTFEGIKQTLISLDSKYMTELQDFISKIELPEPVSEEEVTDAVEEKTDDIQ